MHKHIIYFSMHVKLIFLVFASLNISKSYNFFFYIILYLKISCIMQIDELKEKK